MTDLQGTHVAVELLEKHYREIDERHRQAMHEAETARRHAATFQKQAEEFAAQRQAIATATKILRQGLTAVEVVTRVGKGSTA